MTLGKGPGRWVRTGAAKENYAVPRSNETGFVGYCCICVCVRCMATWKFPRGDYRYLQQVKPVLCRPHWKPTSQAFEGCPRLGTTRIRKLFGNSRAGGPNEVWGESSANIARRNECRNPGINPHGQWGSGSGWTWTWQSAEQSKV